jgi:3-(3-hydroxy-phenyl)propionate hydroxylase
MTGTARIPAGRGRPTVGYRRPEELDAVDPTTRDVVVIGAGLTGLSLALDLALRGISVVVLEQNPEIDVYGIASRGIAYARRTLEIFDRFGIAERVVERGFTWSRGRVYLGDKEAYRFDVQPDIRHRWPSFVNTQQLYVEQILVDRILEVGGADLRWSNSVVGIDQDDAGAGLTVATPDGEYRLRARWVVAADGARGTTRTNIGIESPVVLFEDMWCIVDARIDSEELDERRFTLDSPLVNGGAVIQHRMGEQILRTDWQTANLPEPEQEATPERATERLRSLLGTDAFELVAVSPWRYKVRVMDRFVHGRVIFAGDAAHEIPPFGARGGNSGIQDADNLGWKLAAVLTGRAGPDLLETYDRERVEAARSNAGFAGQSAQFISPQTTSERLFQEAVISLARRRTWARAFVNTGRLSSATTYTDTPLNVDDDGEWTTDGVRPGTVAANGAVLSAGEPGFLLDHIRTAFTALVFAGSRWEAEEPVPAEIDGFPVEVVVVTREPGKAAPGATTLIDDTGSLHERYGAAPTATYLLRPDGHVAGRRRTARVSAATDMLEQILRHTDPGGTLR